MILLLWASLATGLNGCLAPGVLVPKGEVLLQSQKIKGAEHVDKEVLAVRTVQKPNRRILGLMPYAYFYKLGQQTYNQQEAQAEYDSAVAYYRNRMDSLEPGTRAFARQANKRDRRLRKLQARAEEGNWLMRVVGEKPVYFDSSLADESAVRIKQTLFDKGYFYADVDWNLKLKRKDTRGKITYIVEEGRPAKLGLLQYDIEDEQLRKLVLSTSKQSLLVPGQPFNNDKQEQEIDRLFTLIRDNGYFGFSRSFIYIDNDTSTLDQGRGYIQPTLTIESPAPGVPHKRFVIGDMRVKVEESQADREPTDVTEYEGVRYITYTKQINYGVLNTKMQIKPGELYSNSKTLNTQAQLQSMDIFRFVNMGYDTTGSFLNLSINASKLPKYQLSDELGLVVSAGAPGPFVNVGFKVRNPFNGYEIFEINGRYSEEGQIGIFNTSTVFRARELGFNTSLLFPTIVPLGGRKTFLNQYTPRTRFVTGISWVTRPEYSRTLLRGSMTYTVNPTVRSQIGFSPLDLTVNFTTSLDPQFEALLNELSSRGNNLIESFRNAIVSGISGYYQYNTIQTGVRRRSSYFRLGGEFGGSFPSLVAQNFREGGDSIGALKVFQFARLNADYRFNQPLGKYTVLAARINTGVGLPWGNSRLLPWEKYYFSGGSNSIRAWPPRRLGPGSYTQPDLGESGQFLFAFEQPGELILEGNLEIRQSLFKYIEGALFVDAGNVFLLQPNDTRPGAEIQLANIWDQIAVGPGFGIRFDFSFVVLRFDVGIKAWDPARPRGEKYRLNQLSLRRPLGEPGQAVLNVGVGYPF